MSEIDRLRLAKLWAVINSSNVNAKDTVDGIKSTVKDYIQWKFDDIVLTGNNDSVIYKYVKDDWEAFGEEKSPGRNRMYLMDRSGNFKFDLGELYYPSVARAEHFDKIDSYNELRKIVREQKGLAVRNLVLLTYAGLLDANSELRDQNEFNGLFEDTSYQKVIDIIPAMVEFISSQISNSIIAYLESEGKLMSVAVRGANSWKGADFPKLGTEHFTTDDNVCDKEGYDRHKVARHALMYGASADRIAKKYNVNAHQILADIQEEFNKFQQKLGNKEETTMPNETQLTISSNFTGSIDVIQGKRVEDYRNDPELAVDTLVRLDGELKSLRDKGTASGTAYIKGKISDLELAIEALAEILDESDKSE